ncbi:hypothetical protein D0Z07_8952 [Hyphodiscus hymeniophilus]|uniref:NmrA-like domain-containing protein n=1 Tax=Hyphodiscus hymeniophilus TaxID=353542 RepID=A0A9P6SKW5_9HELO|nr:hypothetical protein D0Z07_8952 [Hyphodiscus hymeniophilus]
MTKLIVILGISGKQGGSVARTFLQDPSWEVRGISRNPSSAPCQELIKQGAQIFAGSVNSRDFLITAFQGAHTIFANTDFWSTYRDPSSKSLLAKGQTINEYSFQTEVQQGKNIAEAASKIKTLELFIWSDLVGAHETSGGKWKWVYHFDAKAAVEKYIKQEQPGLSLKTSYFIPGPYVANMETFWKPVKQSDGAYLLQQPGSGDVPFYWIDAVQDSGMFVKALTELGPGKKLLGYGSTMSLREAIKLWGEVRG